MKGRSSVNPYDNVMAASKNEGPHFGSPCNQGHSVFGGSMRSSLKDLGL